MAVKVTVRMGGAAGSVVKDYTSQVPTFEGDSTPLLTAGMMYGQGSASQSEFIIIDDANIIRTLGVSQINAHNQVTITEDGPGYDAWLMRGRIARKQADRGDHPWGTSRTWSATVEDGNVEVRGLALQTPWVRGAETGTNRIIALGAAFLSGSPRLTTNVTVSRTHLVVPNAVDGEVMMPAKTYEAGTELPEIIQDCAETEGQDWGIVIHHQAGVSHLCFLYIDEDNHTTYPCTLSITDTSPNLTTSFPPIWDQGAAVIEEGQEVLSGIVSRYGTGEANYVFFENTANIDKNDYWVEEVQDATSVTAAQANIRAGHLRAGRAIEHTTHQVTIQIPASKVDLICAGMSINIRADASRSEEALGGTATRRIAQVKWEPISPDVGAIDGTYLCHMQLARPMKIARQRRAPVGVKPPVQGGTATFQAAGSAITSDNNEVVALTVGAQADTAIYAAALAHRTGGGGTPVINWHPAYVNDGSRGTGTALTLIADLVHPTLSAFHILVWRLLGPAASTIVTSGVNFFIPGMETGVLGSWLVSGVDQTTPEAATATNSGTNGTSSTVTVGAGNLILDVAGWVEDNAIITAPAPTAGQTQDWSRTVDRTFGVGDVGAGGGHGTATTPTWGFTNAYDWWLAAAVAINSSGGDTTEPVGGTGSGSTGTPGTYAPISHAHEHGSITTGGPYHMAEDVTFVPTGTIAATNVQAAIAEVASEAGGGDHGALTGLAADDHPQYVRTTDGGKEVVNAVAASGATQTLDLALGNFHDVTLTANCTLTLAGATNGVGCSIVLLLRQDATGSRTVTWPASVLWPDGVAPTLATAPSAVDIVSLFTLNGGTTWFGSYAATGGSGADVLVKVSSNDTTAGYLNGKLVAGSGVTLTENLDGANETFTISAGGGGGGSGMTLDPVADVFGTPTTAYEFSTSSLTGLTALGTPAVENAHTTIPGHYYIRDDAAGTAWCGRYIAYSAPFTAIVRLSDHTARFNFNFAAMFIGASTPAAIDIWGLRESGNGPSLFLGRSATLTSDPSTITASSAFHGPPPYLAIRVNSTTSVEYLASRNGYLWFRTPSIRDPLLTVGSVGLAISSRGNGLSAAYDYLRIWNSALTMPYVL